MTQSMWKYGVQRNSALVIRESTVFAASHSAPTSEEWILTHSTRWRIPSSQKGSKDNAACAHRRSHQNAHEEDNSGRANNDFHARAQYRCVRQESKFYSSYVWSFSTRRFTRTHTHTHSSPVKNLTYLSFAAVPDASQTHSFHQTHRYKQRHVQHCSTQRRCPSRARSREQYPSRVQLALKLLTSWASTPGLHEHGNLERRRLTV